MYKRYSIFSGTYKINQIIYILFKTILSLFSKKNFVISYEEKLSKLYNKKYAVSFASGRMALYAILKSLKLKENDEIIIAPFTCVVVINAILYAKCKPIYCDIDKKNYCINLENLHEKINTKTKLIYIQHTFGYNLDFSKLNHIIKKNNILIIEDAAHHFRINNYYKSDLIFNSSDSSKIFDTYLGGTAFTNNHNIYREIKKIQTNSREFSLFNKFRIIISFFIKTFLHNPNIYLIGKYLNSICQKLSIYYSFNDEMQIKLKNNNYTYKIFNFIALIGLEQIKDIENNINHRSNIVSSINNILQIYNFKNRPPPLLRYSFMVQSRKDFEKIFKDYYLSIWFKSMFEGRNANFEDINYIKGSCPNAEYASKHIVNIPTHSNIKLENLVQLLKKNRNRIIENIIRG